MNIYIPLRGDTDTQTSRKVWAIKSPAFPISATLRYCPISNMTPYVTRGVNYVEDGSVVNMFALSAQISL